jgi:hypothetical protein
MDARRRPSVFLDAFGTHGPLATPVILDTRLRNIRYLTSLNIN